jgi:hypothetical protein
MFQGSRIVRSQVLDVEDGYFPRFKNIHSLANGWHVSARKDTLLGPGAEGARFIASDEMQKPPSRFVERTMDNATLWCSGE